MLWKINELHLNFIQMSEIEAQFIEYLSENADINENTNFFDLNFASTFKDFQKNGDFKKYFDFEYNKPLYFPDDCKITENGYERVAQEIIKEFNIELKYKESIKDYLEVTVIDKGIYINYNDLKETLKKYPFPKEIEEKIIEIPKKVS